MGCVRVWLQPSVSLDDVNIWVAECTLEGKSIYLWGVSICNHAAMLQKSPCDFPKKLPVSVDLTRLPTPGIYLKAALSQLFSFICVSLNPCMLSWWAIGSAHEVNGCFVLLIGTGISFFYFDGVSSRLPSPRRWGRQRPLCETLGSYPQSRYVISLNLLTFRPDLVSLCLSFAGDKNLEDVEWLSIQGV